MRIKGLNKKEVASQIIYSHNIKRIRFMSVEYLRELLIEAIEVGYNWEKLGRKEELKQQLEGAEK